MYKQSPSRGHRSKGIKMKHILQICLLLAVCFWLIYQVKHSHEKRKQFDTKDENIVGKVQTDVDIQRLGRKDLPRTTEIATDVEKHEEDEEEREAEEEEQKHEEDEPEREDIRVVEKEEEDGGRGGGDDEIDESEPEKTEAERDEEPVVEEEDKEREDNHDENVEDEDVEKEDHSENEENEGLRKEEEHPDSEENEDVKREDHNEDQDHDGGNTNAHEAREENYKADDASSEVAHDVQTMNPETQNVTIGHANEIWSKVNFGQGNETEAYNKVEGLINSEVQVQPREDDMIHRNNDGTSSNVTVTEEKNHETNLTKSEDSSLQNLTLPNLPNDQPENTSNSTTVGGDQSAFVSSNGTQAESNLSQNGTIEGATGDKTSNLLSNVSESSKKLDLAADEKNQLEASEGLNKTEDLSTNSGESSNSSNSTSISTHETNGIDDLAAAKDSSADSVNQSGNESRGEKSENSDSHSSDEGAEETVEHDPIDASDTALTQEERETRADLDLETLPEIRSEAQNAEDTTITAE